MVSKSNYALVGAFVLVLGAVFIWAVLWISAGGPPQNFDRYVIYMTESVSGLNVDSPLKFRGVDVGKVESIEIDLDNPQRIRLLVQVVEGTPVSSQTEAMLEYQGLTGLANINLIGGQIDAPPPQALPGDEYPVIRTRPSLFARLDSTMSDLLANLIQTTASMNGILTEENSQNVARSIENIATLTGEFAEQSRSIDKLVADLGATLSNTKAASADLPQLVDRVSAAATQIGNMAQDFEQIGANLQTASAGIRETVAGSGDDINAFTSRTLPELSAMISELRLASENLRDVSESLAQDPSVLVYGRTPPSPGPGE